MLNVLKEKTLSDYEGAIEEFCHDNKELTIYLAGEISHPGVSDLDFLVVNNKPTISENVQLFLAGGNVIVMPDFLMSNLKNFENINLSLIQGKDYKINNPDNQFKYVEIIEWLPERILKLESMKNKNFRDQDFLLLHKSVNRSVKLVESLTQRSFDLIEADYVRKSNLNKKIFLEKTLSYAVKAWSEFEKYVIDNMIIHGDVSGSVNICSYYKFNNKFKVLMLYFKRMIKIKESKMSYQLSQRSNIRGTTTLNYDFENYTLKRWKDLDRLFKWFEKNNMKRGMIKYGWFLQNRD